MELEKLRCCCEEKDRAQSSGDYLEPPNDAGTMALPILKISGLPSKGCTNRAADGLLVCSESLFREVWRGWVGVDLWCGLVVCAWGLDLICERFGLGCASEFEVGGGRECGARSANGSSRR
jgi:hypothetical protein